MHDSAAEYLKLVKSTYLGSIYFSGQCLSNLDHCGEDKWAGRSCVASTSIFSGLGNLRLYCKVLSCFRMDEIRLEEAPTSLLEWMVERGINLWETIIHFHHAEMEKVGWRKTSNILVPFVYVVCSIKSYLVSPFLEPYWLEISIFCILSRVILICKGSLKSIFIWSLTLKLTLVDSMH